MHFFGFFFSSVLRTETMSMLGAGLDKEKREKKKKNDFDLWQHIFLTKTPARAPNSAHDEFICLGFFFSGFFKMQNKLGQLKTTYVSHEFMFL